MVDIKDVDKHISSFPLGSKVKVCDEYIKELKKLKEPISYDKELLLKSPWLQRTFFFVNLSLIKDYDERLLYIDKYKEVFTFWGSTDQLIKFVNKSSPSLMMEYASKYVRSKDVYVRRWGYVMFIFHKNRNDKDFCTQILSLIKSDDELTIQMAEGWLLCELAIFNPDIVYDFLKATNVCYKVKSWAISKIQDSFRINDETKRKFKELRFEYYEAIKIKNQN